ncbi:hypothetical protein BOX15_Mlig033738g1, partial [Macrostomum lignano]
NRKRKRKTKISPPPGKQMDVDTMDDPISDENINPFAPSSRRQMMHSPTINGATQHQVNNSCEAELPASLLTEDDLQPPPPPPVSMMSELRRNSGSNAAAGAGRPLSTATFRLPAASKRLSTAADAQQLGDSGNKVDDSGGAGQSSSGPAGSSSAIRERIRELKRQKMEQMKQQQQQQQPSNSDGIIWPEPPPSSLLVAHVSSTQAEQDQCSPNPVANTEDCGQQHYVEESHCAAAKEDNPIDDDEFHSLESPSGSSNEKIIDSVDDIVVDNDDINTDNEVQQYLRADKESPGYAENDEGKIADGSSLANIGIDGDGHRDSPQPAGDAPVKGGLSGSQSSLPPPPPELVSAGPQSALPAPVSDISRKPSMQQQQQQDSQSADQSNRIRQLTGEVERLNAELEGARHVYKEFERCMQQMAEQKRRSDQQVAEIVRDRDQALEDLRSVEKAFSDLHRRFEKSKLLVEAHKKNEETLNKCVQEYQARMKRNEQKYQTLKAHAEEKLEAANRVIEEQKRNSEGEAVRLQAVLRKAELQAQNLQAQLDQKSRENAELTSICDTLIHKVAPE